MPWNEFVDLVAGLRPDTALGRIVQIRTETDKEVLKHYTPEMRKIRGDWQRKAAKGKTEKETQDFITSMQEVFKRMAGVRD